MAMTHAELSAESANYGGLVDVVGGITTVILAIIALSGVNTAIIVPITVIVFGVALLVQGGAVLSEHASFIVSEGAPAPAFEQFGAGSLSAVFLVGAAGIVLGVLSLLGIAAEQLTSVAVISFGAALVLSSDSVRQLYFMRRATMTKAGSHGELIAGEMASSSAGIQILAGLTAIVLGTLAVAGTNPHVLTLSALIVLGATVILTGSTLSGIVMNFMRPTPPSLS